MATTGTMRKTSSTATKSRQPVKKAARAAGTGAAAAKKLGKAGAKTRAPSGAKPGAPAAKKTGGIGDEAVIRATGKSMDHWFKVLDRFDVKFNGHTAAARHLHEKHGVGEWWCQMIVVNYEQARGLRKKHETATGFQVSKSKVLPVPVARAFRAWDDAGARAKWLGEAKLTVRKSTPNKSIRITWKDGTNVEVMFYPRGDGKCSVTVQHNKLPDERAAVRMKAYWGEAMERMAGAVS